MKKALVIVESPAKSKTLSRFLGGNYDIASSMGHIIDLPSSGMGVDIQNRFKPQYIILPARKKIMQELKSRAKGKGIIYLATDPDREGEAISWHLERELVSRGQKALRVEFHEITKKAIEHAFKNPRCLDINKINAQQARRVLDRIVGYNLSPLLWEKVGRGLSAGRVQSVALRLIVEREQEINAFRSQEYWELEAGFKKQDEEAAPVFIARLASIDDKKPRISDKEGADNIIKGLLKSDFKVSGIREQKKTRRPLPPYTTSTMQQDAFNKLRFSASRTMRVAQQLYEGLELEDSDTTGLITYMRTDSLNISKEARENAADYISKHFGKEYMPRHPLQFKGSTQKTQDAHEAIRPTSVYLSPETLKRHLSPEQFKLYELVWKRFLQSQMTPALFNVQTVDITAIETSAHKRCVFRSSVSNILFDGFLILSDIEAKNQLGSVTKPVQDVPHLSKNEALALVRLMPMQHFTKPPARYSDASLVKELEEKGIGRPSTYAPTISTITGRHYVQRRAGYFHPTEVGIVVTGLLVKHFPDILNVSFTARMETELDKVEAGEMDWVEALKDFYKPFAKDMSSAQVEMKDMKKEKIITDYKCQLCGKPMLFRWSRRGTFLGCSGFPKCKYSRPAKRTEDGKIELVEVETIDKVCDKCGKPMMVKYYNRGRFLSCSDYPKCRHTEPYPTGVKCPQAGCDGELVERSSRRGPFYGCSKYPDCKYTSRKLPG
jgi:DNA topoisomerase I